MIIEIRDLTKRYGDLAALDSVSFDVSEGEVFGYLGPNGAGKTTTLMLILGLLNPTSGEVKVMGENVDSVRKKIGVVLDTPGLYEELTFYENLEFFGKLYNVDNIDKRIEELTNLLGLKERINSKVKEFSKGMKQKAAIARSLLHDPELLFFDEPTSGLDPDMQIVIRDVIKDLRKRGKTIFLNSHNLAEVEECCHRVAILRKGKIVEIGAIDELRERYSTGGVLIKVRKDRIKEVCSLFPDSVVKENGVYTQVNISDVMRTLSDSNIKVESIEAGGSSLEELYTRIVKESEG